MSAIYNFVADQISIMLMLADVSIQPSFGPGIVVEASGDDYICSKIKTKIEDESLQISFPIPLINGKYVTSGVVNKNNNHLTINDDWIDENRKISVTIHVPQKTGVNILKLLGDSTIGSISGPLKINGAMGFKMTSVDMAECQVNISSGFKASLGSVFGCLRIVTSSGSSVDVSSVIGDIKIDASSGGKVKITEIASKDVDINSSANGQVEISNGVCLTLSASVSAGAKVELGCSTSEADLKGSSGGKIHLYKCHTTPKISKSSGAVITIG